LDKLAMNHQTNLGSKSSKAQAVLKEEEATKVSTDFKPVDGGSAILTIAEQEVATRRAGEKEQCFVAYILPLIEKCFPASNLVVVDSQTIPWLSQGDGVAELKPDGFITHRGMYEARESKSQDDEAAPSVGPRSGKPAGANFDMHDGYIIEGKLGATIKGQLELVNYLYLVGDNYYKGMLIGADAFWLIRAYRGAVAKRIIAKWTDSGTVQLIHDFFQLSPWTIVLNSVCEKLNVCIAMGKANNKSSIPFLGSGTFGRVFRVKKTDAPDAPVFALKVVLSANIDGLTREYEVIKKIQESSKDAPVVTVLDPLVDLPDIGAGYLMTPVGRSVSLDKRLNVETSFVALSSLHQLGFVHGDPRLSNLIHHGNKLIWIDFMQGTTSSLVADRRQDCIKLACSILHHLKVSITCEELSSAPKFATLLAYINGYSKDPRCNVNTIVQELQTLVQVP
jgi:tRNA A-37 threonylcarbamoyl transferase component Bud32